VSAGARPAELLAPITDLHPFGWLEMLAAVLGRAVLVPGVAAGGADLVHTSVTLADCAGLRTEEVDSVIDIVRTTAPGGVTAVAKQLGPERWQISLRSSGPTDVSAIADSLGGGGHTWAAGYSHDGDYATAMADLLAELMAAEAHGESQSTSNGVLPDASSSEAPATQPSEVVTESAAAVSDAPTDRAGAQEAGTEGRAAASAD
jgi:phosphoesterase RecJ-like protein